MAPPLVDEVLAPWANADVVPFVPLAEQLSLTRAARREVLDSGVIRPVNEVKRGVRPLITKEDALRLAAAAALAFAAGLAVVTVLRVLCGTGAEIGKAGVKIPMPGP